MGGPRPHDLTGSRFGRLVAIERVGRKWRCSCECGKEKHVDITNLTRGMTKSCGCLSREMTAARSLKHGDSHDDCVEYRAWLGMRNRCGLPTHPKYPDYGGRGIRVCERWATDYSAFLADIGRRPSATHSLDRIDVNGNYEPDNCRWATAEEQANNRRPRRYWKAPEARP